MLSHDEKRLKLDEKDINAWKSLRLSVCSVPYIVKDIQSRLFFHKKEKKPPLDRSLSLIDGPSAPYTTNCIYLWLAGYPKETINPFHGFGDGLAEEKING
jgi:hypothetical protein